MLHIYPLCGIFYFPWHRHQIEGINGFYCLIRKTQILTISNVESQVLRKTKIGAYMKVVDIDTMSWEGLAADRTKWMSTLKQHLKTEEDKLMTTTADKRARRKDGSSSIRLESTLCLDVMSATKTATPARVCSATSDAATAQQDINTLSAKDGDLRLSASNACLPKTEISVFVTECVFFTSTCYKLNMFALHDVLYS